MHRDYSVDGMISVTYFGEELRIHSPGAFFGGVTSDNIARHEPRHRNKNLARILMTHDLVDRAGIGAFEWGSDRSDMAEHFLSSANRAMPWRSKWKPNTYDLVSPCSGFKIVKAGVSLSY